MKTTLMISNVCSAFQDKVIGSRVIDSEKLSVLLVSAIGLHDTSKDKVSGQHYIVMSKEANETVSAGVGKRLTNPSAYVLRAHRGKVLACLSRKFAANTESVAVIVYTREAYLADPDTQKDTEEAVRITNNFCTHIVVAVLASAGPKSPLTAHRFTYNLAGNNREALQWDADEIRTKAKEVSEYWEAWDVVAD